MPDTLPFPQPARRLERRRIINDTSIRSIKPPVAGAVDYFDDLTPGLSLRITSTDVRTWTVFYRDKHARQKRLRLGRYPSVKLVDVRELAHAAQRSAAKGGDPVVDKRAARGGAHVRRAGKDLHRRLRQTAQEKLGRGSASHRC